jgi:hypothetical protein
MPELWMLMYLIMPPQFGDGLVVGWVKTYPTRAECEVARREVAARIERVPGSKVLAGAQCTRVR